MAVRPARERRPAIWPYLVMPLVVLLIFYVLYTLHQRPREESASGSPQDGAQREQRQ